MDEEEGMDESDEGSEEWKEEEEARMTMIVRCFTYDVTVATCCCRLRLSVRRRTVGCCYLSVGVLGRLRVCVMQHGWEGGGGDTLLLLESDA